MSAGAIISGRDLPGDLSISAQVVVVGSGAGGAVVAKVLAEAGLDVVVLEEGGHTPPEVYGKYRPTETLRYMGREAGTTAAFGLGDTPFVSIMAGRCVGGSSVLTGGVCFRIPEAVTREWVQQHGLSGYSSSALEEAYLSVEDEVHVETVPESARSMSTVLFAQGAEIRGHPLKPIRRNTKGCNGCGRCNFGCPHGAKLSVDITYLRKAVQAGARIYADCYVSRVFEEHGRAAGVIGRVLGPMGKLRGKLRVRADTVVVSAGTLHTPLILMRTGVGRRSKALGRRVTLHPSFRVGALFDQQVNGWHGALQSAYTDKYQDEGIALMGAFAPLNVLAGAFPGIGPAHRELVKQLGHLAIFGGLVHDEGGGRIFRGPNREPLVFYRMARRDKERFFKGMHLLAETFFAAGAKQVFLPLFGVPVLRSADQLSRYTAATMPSRLVESVSFHPLGSARMGVDSRHGVVGASGESFDLPGLYVADGSLFPTSIGVNSQMPIMTVATQIAWGLRERLTRKAPEAQPLVAAAS